MSTTCLRHALGLSWWETGGMGRAAHALRTERGVWLVDPFQDDAALAAAAEIGPAAGVVQLLDRHNRDGSALAQRLEVPLLRLPHAIPDSPLQVVPVADRPWWREIALWWEPERALVVAEALGTAPVFGLGRRVGVHPLLRLTPPRRALGPLAPDRLLVGHGPPLLQDAAPAVREALGAALTDIPQLALRLPRLLRGG
jgi:hypothetical protein